MLRLLKAVLVVGVVLTALIGGSWLIYMPSSDARGTWRAQSGNMLIDLGMFSARVYGDSSHSCGLLYGFPAHMKLVELMEGARAIAQDGKLILTLDGSLEPQVFDRIDRLPAACTTPVTPTPRNVFDAMWTAMEEHYAFFDLHGVDWAARAALAPAPDAQMSDRALLDLLGKALDGLDDGHIQIGTPFAYLTPRQRPDWLPETSPLTRDGLRDVARRNSGAALTRLPDTTIDYGIRADGIVYVLIGEMSVSQALGQGSQEAAALHFDQLTPILAGAKGIILDVRHNPGGSDGISFGIASHFTDADLPVFTKSTRVGTGQSDPFTAILRGFDDTPLTAPVVVLTSDLTASAAEIFTLAMRELPHVTVIGEPTSGGLSDILGFNLPNGWAFGLSNQTYLTMDGTLFEAVGITPDVAVPFVAADFEAGRDPVLATAIEQLGGQ